MASGNMPRTCYTVQFSSLIVKAFLKALYESTPLVKYEAYLDYSKSSLLESSIDYRYPLTRSSKSSFL
jgi:hypothetical protein